MNMKKDNKSRFIIAGVVIIFMIIISIVYVTNQDEIKEILDIKTSNTEEYVSNPKTLQEWQEINSDVIMVLEFTSNGILHNIPVLEVDDGAKYMKRNPWGNYDSMGSVFIEKDVSPVKTSNNWLINGHSSYNKDWNFTFLKNYAKSDYFKKHLTFQVEMEDGYHQYEIISFAEYDFESNENIYDGWFNNKFSNQNEVISMIKATEPYILQRNTGIAYNGKQLITLITCNMKKNDARYVLTAIEK